MMYKRKQSVRGIFQPCGILSILIISASQPNCLVQGFATPPHAAFPRPFASNEMKAVNGDCQRENGRSLALMAVSFTCSSPATSSGRTSHDTGRIRNCASSTRLYNGSDDNDSDDSSSPYWFAKVKATSSASASAETSQPLPKQDLPAVEEPPVPPPQPVSPVSPPPQQPIPAPSPRYSGAADTRWVDLPTSSSSKPPQPSPPPQQSSPASRTRYSGAADSRWIDLPPNRSSDWPQSSSPSPQQSAPASRTRYAGAGADTRWTDLPPKTSKWQPASGNGFMPIFGAVPETTTPASRPYQSERTPEKRTKPKGGSDQERDLRDANIATERAKPKGASDQERELSVANIATEPVQSGKKTEAIPSFDARPPLAVEDFQPPQGRVLPRTIRVQEIEQDEEEDDDDNSVSPIILEYLNQDGDAGDASYMQTIVFPFRVDPNVRPEEKLGRENDAPMFTPAVKADIYKVLRSPDDPKAGGQAPSSGPASSSSSSPFAATLLCKLDEGTYAFCDRSLYDSIEEHKKQVSSTDAWDKLATYTPLDDDQMLKAVACIGQTSPNSLAITKAFEAYLSQKAWGWGDYQASAFSVEFLIAFGNELSTRLDINHRIRSRKLSAQELLILSKPPFCNYVQPDAMKIFQNQWTDLE